MQLHERFVHKTVVMVKEGAINGTNETQDGYKNRRWNCEILWVKNGTNCATLNGRIKKLLMDNILYQCNINHPLCGSTMVIDDTNGELTALGRPIGP